MKENNSFSIEEESALIKKEIEQKALELEQLEKMQKIVEEYKNSTDKSLVEFAESYSNSDNSKCFKYDIGKVGEKQAKEITQLVGFDVANYTHIITSATIRHIEKRHGKNGLQDKSMQEPEDIARINYVLNNYDKVELSQRDNAIFHNLDGTNAKNIIYTKRVNGTVVVIEVAPNTHKQELHMITMYKTKAKEKTAEKQLSVVEDDRPCVPKPRRYVQNAPITSSTNIIPHSKKKVKKIIKEDLER